MGVPFWWVLEKMWWPWAMVVGALVAIFFVIDTLDHRRAARVHEHDGGATVRITGVHNLLLVAAVVGAVFQHGFFEVIGEVRGGAVSGVRAVWEMLTSREVVMVAAGVVSRLVTRRGVYEANEFTFGPIKEVAILFVGIFATMVPATQYVQANAARMPLRTAGDYYFTSGVLSSVLDNAPTYKTLLETRLAGVDAGLVAEAQFWLEGMGREGTLAVPAGVPAGPVRRAVEAMVRYHPEDVVAGRVGEKELGVGFLRGVPEWSLFVVAISAGSVFWGACTYIGNGPNFMVKAIADAAGARTPSFGEYVWRYTLPVLVPIYVVVWGVFFR
jgi:Na+/H+ antiporter NhaD/arsenite permease-like protein